MHYESRPNKRGNTFSQNCSGILVGTENGDLSLGAGLAEIYDFLTGLRRGHDEKIEKRGEEGGKGRLVKKMAGGGMIWEHGQSDSTGCQTTQNQKHTLRTVYSL